MFASTDIPLVLKALTTARAPGAFEATTSLVDLSPTSTMPPAGVPSRKPFVASMRMRSSQAGKSLSTDRRAARDGEQDDGGDYGLRRGPDARARAELLSMPCRKCSGPRLLLRTTSWPLAIENAQGLPDVSGANDTDEHDWCTSVTRGGPFRFRTTWHHDVRPSR